jgi:NADPH:quinone reductase-like Zn-dependent oxidoreductase
LSGSPRLLDAGTLSVPIRATYPLAQADQALKALTTQHTQGKLSITLP